MSDETLLVLSNIAFPLGSARGISQSNRFIGALAKPRRTINAVMADVSDAKFRLYEITLTCSDQRPPTLDDTWIGATGTLDWCAEMVFVTHTGSPSRPIVEGSERTEGSFTFYRPRSNVVLMDMSDNFAEWEAGREWMLKFEENPP
jgi:hypothetical protein